VAVGGAVVVGCEVVLVTDVLVVEVSSVDDVLEGVEVVVVSSGTELVVLVDVELVEVVVVSILHFITQLIAYGFPVFGFNGACTQVHAGTFSYTTGAPGPPLTIT